MFEMKLATCEALMGVLPESTDSLKTSYLSRENTNRLVIVDFVVGEVRYALNYAAASADFHNPSESRHQHGLHVSPSRCSCVLHLDIDYCSAAQAVAKHVLPASG